MKFENRMSQKEQDRRISVTMDGPFQKFLNIRISERGGGKSTIEMDAAENILNATGFVHGGAIYAMLDVAAYIALVPLMDDNMNAVTHDIFVNIMRPSPAGSKIVFNGFIRKIGKRLAFCESEAYIDGELIATAKVTKSIVDLV